MNESFRIFKVFISNTGTGMLSYANGTILNAWLCKISLRRHIELVTRLKYLNKILFFLSKRFLYMISFAGQFSVLCCLFLILYQNEWVFKEEVFQQLTYWHIIYFKALTSPYCVFADITLCLYLFYIYQDIKK